MDEIMLLIMLNTNCSKTEIISKKIIGIETFPQDISFEIFKTIEDPR